MVVRLTCWEVWDCDWETLTLTWTQTSVNVCVKMCRVAADKMALQGDLDVLPVGGDHAAVAVLALGPRPLGQHRGQPGQHHTQLHASEVFSFF